MAEWVGVDECAADFNECTNFLAAVEAELRPKLGPCTEGDVLGAYNVGCSRYLEFHPREHRLRARLAKTKA